MIVYRGLGMHIWRLGRSELGSGVVRNCSGGSGLSLDTTKVCPGLVGCHGYDRIQEQGIIGDRELN